MRLTDNFDPATCSKEDMRDTAKQLLIFLDQLQSTMVYPDEVKRDQRDKFEEGIRRSRKLAAKLIKGDKSIFEEEYL